MDNWLGTRKIYFLYLAATLASWFLESFFDTYLHEKGIGYWSNIFPFDNGDELRMRFFFAFVLFLFFWSVHKNTVHTIERIKKEKKDKEKIRKSGEQFKEFSASVIHDLKSPSIALEGFTQYLLKNFADKLGEKGEWVCKNILQSTKNVGDLIKTINEYMEVKEHSQEYPQKYPQKIERVSIKEVVGIIRDEFSIRMAIRQITLVYPDILPEINIDRNSLIRIFRNLVDNALKYGGESLSEIKITYHLDKGSFHVFSVIDNGEGIKLKNPDKAFKRYETSSVENGSGLGLAIVKEIAEQHGGKAWLNKDNYRQGTCICFSVDEYFLVDEQLKAF